MILEMPYLCAGSLVFVPGGLVFRRRYYFGPRLCVLLFTSSKAVMRLDVIASSQ